MYINSYTVYRLLIPIQNNEVTYCLGGGFLIQPFILHWGTKGMLSFYCRLLSTWCKVKPGRCGKWLCTAPLSVWSPLVQLILFSHHHRKKNHIEYENRCYYYHNENVTPKMDGLLLNCHFHCTSQIQTSILILDSSIISTLLQQKFKGGIRMFFIMFQ